MLHLDILGMGRPYRSLSGTAHIFYPIIAIGLIYLISFFKFGSYQKYFKYTAIILFIVLILVLNAKPAYKDLSNAYPDILRINNEQYQATVWIKDNIPESAQIYQIGEITQAKSRWLWMLSNRVIGFRAFEEADYVLIDYNDIISIGNQEAFEQLKQAETTINGTLLYDKNNIRVYEIEK